MLKKIINFIVNRSGMSSLWAALDGHKATGSAFVGVLTSMLGLINGIGPCLANHDVACTYSFIKDLPHNEYWLGLIASGYALGMAFKFKKTAALMAGEEAAPPPAQ